jgi:hypothetical protein
MTPSGIEPATFRFVEQYLNHCATAVPRSPLSMRMNFLSPTACYMSSKVHSPSLDQPQIPRLYTEPEGRYSNHT